MTMPKGDLVKSTGTVDAVNEAVTIYTADLEDVAFTFDVTSTITLKVEISNDAGTTWSQVDTDKTADGVYALTIACEMARIRCSAVTGGSAFCTVAGRRVR
jgi:hypothetical protein